MLPLLALALSQKHDNDQNDNENTQPYQQAVPPLPTTAHLLTEDRPVTYVIRGHAGDPCVGVNRCGQVLPLTAVLVVIRDGNKRGVTAGGSQVGRRVLDTDGHVSPQLRHLFPIDRRRYAEAGIAHAEAFGSSTTVDRLNLHIGIVVERTFLEVKGNPAVLRRHLTPIR